MYMLRKDLSDLDFGVDLSSNYCSEIEWILAGLDFLGFQSRHLEDRIDDESIWL